MVTEFRLPFEAASVPKARRELGSDLRRSGVASARVDDAMLVLSELVANAIRHARPLPTGDIRVRWRLDENQLELSVVDGGGRTRPQLLNPPLAAIGGRGLSIVNGLAADWGVRSATGSAERVRTDQTVGFSVSSTAEAGRTRREAPAETPRDASLDDGVAVYAVLPLL